jgi:hypothetical protein
LSWEILADRTAPKTAIIIPVEWRSFVQFEWARHFWERVQKPPKSMYFPSTGSPLVETRNDLVKIGLENGAEWLVFWDCDVIPPDNGLMKLNESKYAITSGVYWARKAETNAPAAWMNAPGGMVAIGKDQPARYVSVDKVGMGFCRIHRSVFEKVPEPWFKWTMTRGPLNPASGRFDFIPGGTSEDLYFCTKAKENGFSILIDMEVKCQHIGVFKVMEDGAFKPTEL